MERKIVKKRKYYGREKDGKFGGVLKAWRENADLTLHEAAVLLDLRCKCPEAYLCQIEKGHRPIPDKLLVKVPDVYKVAAEEVIKQAYHPQLSFPFFDELIKPTDLPKPFKDYLQELNEQSTRELTLYAAFLISRQQVAKPPK